MTTQLSPPLLDLAAAGSPMTTAAPPAVPRSRVRRFGRGMARFALLLAALLAVSVGANAVLMFRESLAPSYGQLVTLPGGGRLNTAVSGSGEETFVIMTGYAAASPVLEFAPLVDDLDDHATVVVVEPFGYGFSDRQTDADRTIENITTELHQTLTALHVHQPYTLVAHSIGAIYALDYVNRFPGEVGAVVTIDGSVPIDSTAEGGESRWNRLWTLSGVTRWVMMVAPGALVHEPRDTYSDSALRQMQTLVIRDNSTSAVVEENTRMGQNVEAVKGLAFPAELPVLAFVARDTMGLSSEWLPAHQEQLEGLVRSQLIIVDDGHYLHYRHSPEIADAARAFLDAPTR
jgi:pimeloyl-ACP methyl ester carboxylesterase